MDPMSLIGAGTSLVGGIMGAQAAREANEQNWQINMLNFMLANNERMDRIKSQYSAKDDRRKEEGKQALGSTDVMGNHTYFDPLRGWVTDLSGEGRRRQAQANKLDELQNSERVKQLTHDIPLQRYQADRNFDQNNQNADQASIFAKMLHTALVDGPSKYDTTSGALYNSQSQGINEGYDKQTQEATRDAVRQGTNASGVLAELARARGQDLSKASMSAYLQGRQMQKQDYNEKIGNLTNLYNAFMGSSRGNMNAPQYQPIGADFNAASVGQASPQVSAMTQLQLNDGAQQLAEAYGQKGGRVDYVEPDYGMANALAGFGSVLSKTGGGGSQYRPTGMSSGGSSSGGSSGGLFGSLLGNGGLF